MKLWWLGPADTAPRHIPHANLTQSRRFWTKTLSCFNDDYEGMQINDLLQDTKIISFDTDFDLNQGDPSALGWEGDSTLRKKRVLKKAPEAPKRFKSAYICYVIQKMDEMKQTVDGDAKVYIFQFLFLLSYVKLKG